MKFFVLIFAALALASASPTEYSSKEAVYKYTTDFRTGVIKPDKYGSQFMLKADLHGQWDEEQHTGVFYFSDVLISLYNGELLFDGKTEHEEYHQLKKELSTFESPFMVEYSNNTGLFKELFTSADEPKWIVNIKKSVVSLFQFNWQPFDEIVNSTVPTTYQTEEETIYGQCLVSYNVQPIDKEWIVTKHYDPEHCSHFSQSSYSNFETTECDNGHIEDDSFLTENRRVYHVAEKEQQSFEHYFKKIESNGEIFLYPYRDGGEVKYVHVHQTIVFDKYQTKKALTFTKKVPHKMDFSFDHLSEEEVLEATTFSYTSYYGDETKQTKLELCLSSIEKLAHNYSNGDYYNYAIKTLSYFTIEDFEMCAKNLPGPGHSSPELFLETFYKIVPLIGTKASVVYIKNVVKSKDFNTATAISMLQYLPFYVIVPTEQMLVDLNEFVDPNYVPNQDVKHTAILAYSTLIYRTFKSHPESPVLRKYIKTYYTYLKTATTYSEQLVWLQGLKNIEIGHVWQLVLPLIKGDQVLSLTYDHHLREHAIWSAFSLVRQHEKEFYDVLWSIITNKKEYTNLRVAAVKVYFHGMTTTKRLNQIFRYMQTETNPQVYNFFITTLESLHDAHCETIVSKHAKLVLKYLKNYGSSVNTYAFSHQVINEELGFGGHIHGNQIADDESNQAQSTFVQFDAYALHKTANVYSFYAKYEGTSKFIDLFFARTNIYKEKEIHNEFMFMINNKFVFVKYFDKNTIKGFNPKDLLNMHKTNEFINIMDIFNFNKIMPTDFGLPVVFDVKMPMITKLNMEMAETNGKHLITFNLQQTLNGNYGTAVFNPFVNAWQGAMRQVHYDINLNFFFEVSSKGITVSLDNYNDANNFTATTQVQTVVFLAHKTDSKLLKDLCKTCSLYQRVNEFSLYQQEFNELTELKQFGLDLNVEISECEGYYAGETSFKDTIMEGEYLSFFGKVPFTEFMLYFNNFISLHLLSPTINSCRHVFSVVPSTDYPVEKLTLEFNVDQFKVKKGDQTKRFEMAPVFTIFKTDETKTTKYETKFYMEVGTQLKEYGLEMNRIVKGQPILNICFDYSKDFEDGSYTGEYNYYEGYSYEKECVKDAFKVNIFTTSEKSEEQQNLSNQTYTYKACEHKTDYMSIDTPLSMDCIKAHTSLRTDKYFVQYKNLPTYYNNLYTELWKWIKATYNYDVKVTPEKTLKTGTFSVEVNRPVTYTDNTADVVVTFPLITFIFTDEYYPGFLKPLESSHFGHQLSSCLKEEYSCVARTNEKVLVGHYTSEEKFTEYNKWSKLFGIHEDFLVEVQQETKNDMALKLTYNNNTMTVHYDHEQKEFVYKMDQHLLKTMMFAHSDEVKPYGMEMLQIGDSVVFLIHKYQIHVIYNKEYVKIETENVPELVNNEVYGTCVKNL